MEKHETDRSLTCILFPGVIKNTDKALQCLGGIRNISQVYCQPNKKRLGLNFQPENPFIKRIFADARPSAGVLLSVRVKKTKEGNEVKKQVISTSVLGRVKKMYRFESLCDFQYLPVHKEGSAPPQCILEQIIPSGLDHFDFLSEPSLPFIVPSNFTRSDKPINYAYTEKRYLTEKNDISPDRRDDVHYRTRSDRGAPLARYRFNLVDSLPTEPLEYHVKHKMEKAQICPQLEQEFETIKKLFDERPIWSQNLLRYQTKIRSSSLKIILPCLSCYMLSGPWRMLWVRLGYDPRKEPGARYYQTLDFRLRQTAGVRSMVMTRDQVTHYKKADRVRFTKRKDEEPAGGGGDGGAGGGGGGEDVSEGAVRFRPGMVPSQRQIFYMYCDVKLPEVEAILSAAPPPGYLCHQKRGWLPPNADHVCRDHIFRYVKQTLLATHSAELKLEQGSSDEESCSNDEDGASNTATEVDEAGNQ